jgi:hypothetical protein
MQNNFFLKNIGKNLETKFLSFKITNIYWPKKQP